VKNIIITVLAAALIISLCQCKGIEMSKDRNSYRFNPMPLDDDWSKWLVGEWEGSGGSDTGSGKSVTSVELVLNGQFRIHKEEAVITEITPEQRQYLKKNMHATDEEIDRFKSLPFKDWEIYTIEQGTGDVVGYLFDSLRCIAKGRGKREGNKEIVEWEWATGHKSTRITERVSDDKVAIVQRTLMPDGSVMEEKSEKTRRK
jgi:hypothetical protein